MNNSRRQVLAALALSPLAACDSRSKAERQIDAAWHRSAALEGHLAHWLAHAPRPDGSFRINFGRDWTPKPGQNLEVTLQGRMIYTMAIGYELSQDKRYLQAAVNGGEFLLKKFADPVHGGFFLVLSPEGQVLSDAKRCYGHAFALFGLAHLFRVTKEPRWRDAALEAWHQIERGLGDPTGGFHNQTPRNFLAGPRTPRSQNPLMHMFEAQLALLDATGDASARDGARRLGDFVVNRLMQGRPDGTACIPEWFDADWKPLPTKEAGGFIDIGHQFEWSHLLLRASALGLSPLYAPVSDRILQYALKEGYDEIDGGAINQTYPDAPPWKSKGWWQQAECLRALIVAATVSGRNELWRRYDQTLSLVQAELVDTEMGGWRPGLCRRGGCDDVQPDPYHMLGMHMEALRAAGSVV